MVLEQKADYKTEWSIEIAGVVIPFRLWFYVDGMEQLTACFDVDFNAEEPDIHTSLELAEEIALHLGLEDREVEVQAIHDKILDAMGFAHPVLKGKHETQKNK